MRVLIDTAVFIWMVNRPARLSREAARILKKPNTVITLSVVSLLEMAIKIQAGKLDLTKEQIRAEIAALSIELLPWHAGSAYAFFDLPLHHHDPLDRQILAQAMAENLPIVTPDEVFGEYPVQVIW